MNTNCHRTEKNRAHPSTGLASGCCTSSGSRRGIALVITLIMLSVTLVMALAFLALARRERSSVSTTTDATNAKLAADSALAAAQSQLIANLLNANNTYFKTNGPYNFGLLVSTNYINTNGFLAGYANPANVNYDHLSNSFAALNLADFELNVANLQFLPRVPVFVQNPNNPSSSLDFRYYLDLDRNGMFDPTAFIDNSVTNGPLNEVGDPQWIGILSRPDVPHSAQNQFVSRYAFAAIPISEGLDINAIHNQTVEPEVDQNDASYVASGYFRNEGVGSWEINLAAFLTDLNVNQWDPPGIAANQYNYNQADTPNNVNLGFAFQDALSILSYRYGYNASSQAQLASVFGTPNVSMLYDQPFDLFPYGSPTRTPLNGTFTRYYANNLPAGVNIFWPGSNNTNRYFNLPSDLFNPSETSPSFVQRLTAAGENITNYDRYTFYRLLSQLGTDSDPDDGKMNLNFRNITNGVVVPNMETNLYAWSPLTFFTNAADRMLRMYTTNWFYAGPTNYLSTYYFITNYNGLLINSGRTLFNYNNANNVNVAFDPTGFGLTNVSTSRFLGWTNQVPAFGITNIPVYINGRFVYSPAVNRVLQLAANLYDASTNSYYPSVFRPLFQHDNLGNVFITGFTNVSFDGVEGAVSGIYDPQLSAPLNVYDVTNWNSFASTLPIYTNGQPANIYGVPWIVGAKEGFPNFNKFGMQTFSQTVRRLQVTRSEIPTTAQTTFLTNQLLSFSVSNVINMDCWNSYTNVYTNSPIYIHALDTLSMSLTNNDGAPAVYFNNQAVSNTIVVPNWAAYNTSYPQYSFTNPLSTFSVLLSNADFHFESPQGFYTDANSWESNYYGLNFPQFGLTVTNHLQLYMLAQSGADYHVIDYVQFGGPQNSVNLTQLIETNNPQSPGYGPYLWSQALNKNNLPWGPANQVLVSESQISSYGGTGYWSDNSTNEAMINGFANFMGLAEPYPNLTLNNPTLDEISTYYASNLTVQVPYTPIVNVSEYTSWQANDPLVHYLSSDLTFNGVEQPSQAPTGVQVTYNPIGYVPKYPTFNSLNDRYQPWGVNKLPTGSATPIDTDRYDTNSYDLSFKDPLIWGSYNWGFPTNKYPTPGWIGRVHRGTPWQTVYLKANNIITNGTWGYYSGINTWAYYTGDFNYYDASNSSPVEDRMLFDLFTTRPNDNAALGTLSVNQTNLAAWSAIFSGMVALTNVGVMPNFVVQGRTFAPSNSWVIVQPAGFAGNASALGRLVNNINSERLLFTNVDGVVGSFEHIGDILSTPALTEYSPFLNTNVNQRTYGISDATYEWLPQQMMGLLRNSDTSRYLVYGYGQALRPAPAGVDLGSTQFGLVTNYQVVAESDVRAVIAVQKHVDTSGHWPQTNYTTRVESYSVLPPN